MWPRGCRLSRLGRQPSSPLRSVGPNRGKYSPWTEQTEQLCEQRAGRAESDMLLGLTQLPWTRRFVSRQPTRDPPAAHHWARSSSQTQTVYYCCTPHPASSPIPLPFALLVEGRRGATRNAAICAVVDDVTLFGEEIRGGLTNTGCEHD